MICIIITWDVNDSRAGVQGRRSEGPHVFAFASLHLAGPLPVGGHHLQVLYAVHRRTTWKQAELSGPSETCALPAGEQLVA